MLESLAESITLIGPQPLECESAHRHRAQRSAGKIRAIGTSAFPAADIVEAQWVAERRSLARPRMELQSYSILDRAIERTVLPTCQPVWHGSDGVEPRSKGMLTGKYRRGQPTPDTLRAMRFPKMVSDTRTLEVVDQLVPLAQDAGL